MNILLTGFEPFGGERINPSWLLAQALAAQAPKRMRVAAVELPTAFDASAKLLKAAMAMHQPQAVVCLGQAGGRAALGFERIAINLNDAPIADNLGQQPHNQAIAARGPVAYWSTLPIAHMAQAAQSAGVAAEISNSAGTFVCNHVFYALMRLLARNKGVRGGFVHVPYLPEQSTTAPTMPLATMVLGMQAALLTLGAAPKGNTRQKLQTGRLA
jgi:pyroglutamyl-peptidase